MKKMSMRRYPESDCESPRPAIMDHMMHNPVPKPACDEAAGCAERDIERKQAPNRDKA